MSVRTVLAALLAAAPAAAQDRTVKGTVTDADGKPVAGVEVSHLWRSWQGSPLKPDAPAVSAADGTFAAKLPGWKTPAALLALTPDRGRAALAVVTADAGPLALTLRPAVRVAGTFDCTELGRRPGWTNVYVGAGAKNLPVIEFASDRAEFQFPLPPGDYQFHGYGSDVIGRKKPLAVPADRSALDLGAIDLKATAVAKMVGKPPLPWTLADARGLSKGVQIADLKGKWVVLDFWGHWCGPCVRELADLIDFCELYKDHRDKFEIVALHDSSVPDFAAMDKKLAPIKQSLWGGRDLPFPILLDADKRTATAYTIQSWPTTLLIDPDGKVVGETHGTRELEGKLPSCRPG